TAHIHTDSVGSIESCVRGNADVLRPHSQQQRVEIAPPLPHPPRLIIRQAVAVADHATAQIVRPRVRDYLMLNRAVAGDRGIAAVRSLVIALQPSAGDVATISPLT